MDQSWRGIKDRASPVLVNTPGAGHPPSALPQRVPSLCGTASPCHTHWSIPWEKTASCNECVLNVSNKAQHSRAAAEYTASDWETPRMPSGQILVMGQWPPPTSLLHFIQVATERAAFTCESEISPAGATCCPRGCGR